MHSLPPCGGSRGVGKDSWESFRAYAKPYIPHADNKSRSQTSPPGFKLIEDFPTLDEDNKYTFIDCTAETLQSSGSTRIVSKRPRGYSEKPLMNKQRSYSPAGEDISFMDLFTCLTQGSEYEKP